MTELDRAPDIFHLSLEFRTGAAVAPAARLNLRLHKLLDCDRYDDERSTLVVWGIPVVNGKILRARELLENVRSKGLSALAPKLDCGFLFVIHNKQDDRLSIVTDRTGSLPLFYTALNGRLIASSSFKRLFDAQGAGASSSLDPWTIAEFFYFRRVFGTRTYDSAISYLPYSSILTINGDGKIEHQRYWRPKADKLRLGHENLADRLAGLLSNSMKIHMSDDHNFGLLLSGGLDARALLAAAPRPPVCFTTTPKPNNELAVAEELARIKGSEHVYLPRPEQLLNDALAPSVALSGGMTIFNEVQFIGYGDKVTPRADALFMGLALDIMFCGHYLPKSLVSYGGRSGWHFRLHDLPADMPIAFADTVSYRLKTSDPMRVVRTEYRKPMRERLIETIRAEMQEGRDIGFEGYDLWEYVHLHNFARHYSLLMAQSVRTFAACRIPAFTNALYDLCWAMRAEDKYNWVVYQKAIAKLSPQMMRVRNANTNIRADVPLQRQSLIKFARAIGGRLGVRGGEAPSWWDRSWPQARQAIDVNTKIQERVKKLPQSAYLEAIRLFDLSAVDEVVSEHLRGHHDHTVLLNELITIERALQPFDQ